MPSDPLRNRLRWQCRRGMLELDLLLEGFIDAHWNELNAARREDLARLLAQPDELLLDWLHRNAVPADPRLRDLVGRIIATEGDARCARPNPR